MANVRHLRNAPIIEALIDFGVRLPAGFDASAFSSLKNELSGKYPKTEARRVISGSITIKDGKPMVEPPVDKGLQGFKFTSEDGKDVAQFRLDGFTFSRLQPYTDWQMVLDEAKRLWDLYRATAVPEAISRIAVRYINRLDIPLPVNDLSEYLTSPPVLPPTLPQELSKYLLSMQTHEEDLVADVLQTLVASPKKEHVGFIIDIQASRVGDGTIDEESAWATFNKLRELKNRIFFGLITEKTARRYE